MAHKMITFAIVQAIIFQLAYSQVIGRYGGCGCPNILQEQIVNYPNFIPGPTKVVYDQPTTIIQDSTVANNLANALQLLVVSNLLSNTLPLEQSLPAPLELLPGYAAAPLALAPSINGPLQFAPNVINSFPNVVNSCGCGACNSCGLSGLGPYNFVY